MIFSGLKVMKNLRWILSIVRNIIPFSFSYIPLAEKMIRDRENYSDEERFKLAQKFTNNVRNAALTETDVFGEENLPKEGGYILYSNHQGKYDGVCMVCYHKRPLSILWDVQSSHQIVAKQVCGLLDCARIDHSKPETFLPIIKSIAEKAAAGRPYLIYPEGKTSESNEKLLDFQTGCFMASTLSKTPIVPVVLYDSHKSLNTNDLFHKVRTQLHYLPPIPYSEYGNMNRKKISALVQERIQAKLDELNHRTERTN